MNEALLADLEQVVALVMATMADATTCLSDLPYEQTDDQLVGAVHIDGAWQGAVALHLPRTVASPLAAAFLGLPLEEVTEADLLEVTGELTNMVGGNFKSLLPAPCRLSIPKLATGIQPAAPVAASHWRSFDSPYGLLGLSVNAATDA